LARAREALDEADLLAEAGHGNGCVNRLYYACFYAVTAILLQHDLSASKHSGVRSLFNQHIVKSGLIAASQAEIYNELFSARQQADYRDFVRFDPTEVSPWLHRSRLFIQRLEELLTSPKTEQPDA
jgi:uncharacterized protein